MIITPQIRADSQCIYPSIRSTIHYHPCIHDPLSKSSHGHAKSPEALPWILISRLFPSKTSFRNRETASSMAYCSKERTKERSEWGKDDEHSDRDNSQAHACRRSTQLSCIKSCWNCLERVWVVSINITDSSNQHKSENPKIQHRRVAQNRRGHSTDRLRCM